MTELDINEENMFLDQFIELNPHAIVIFDENGIYIKSNKEYRKLYDIKNEQEFSLFDDPILKKSDQWDKFIHALNRGETFQILDICFNITLNNQDYRSKEKHYNISLIPIKDDGRDLQKYLLMYVDISEQKRIEKELENERYILNNIIERNPYAIGIFDKDGYYLRSNKAARDLFGAPPPQSVSLYDAEYAKKGGKVYDEVQEFKNGNAVHIPEVWVNPKKDISPQLDERDVCFKTEIFPIFNIDGEYAQIVAMYEDITDRKIAEEKLKESEENYRLISENVNDLISVINFKLKYEYINEERHKKLLGYTKQDLIGNSALHLIHPADRKHSIKVLREGEVSEGKSAELRVQHKDGHYVWLEVKGRGFMNKDGEYKVYMIARDITERKKTERKIENLMNELERRVKYRTSKLEKSEEKYRMAYDRATCFKGLFTHDINNMFHAISNAIELFEMEEYQTISLERLTETFELVKRQIDRGRELIENIQNLSEIEQSEMKLEPTEVNNTIRNAIEFVKNNFKHRKIRASLNAFQRVIYVDANELLVDVFENILINSVRYTESQKVIIDIEISKFKKGTSEYIKIEFKDFGIGIPDSQKELIFKEKAPKPNSKGLGLGLSYVAKLLDLCYGKIRVENRIEDDYTQGSNFIVEIPKSKSF